MRHFLIGEFGPEPVSVPRLARSLEAPRTSLRAVRGTRSPQGVPPLEQPALSAEPLPAVAARAKPQLQSTPLALGKPVLFRRHEAPCRRFLDMALRT